MLILFDHGAPKGVARALYSHTVVTARARGWDRLTNGALLQAAEEERVDMLFTDRPANPVSAELNGPQDCDCRFNRDHQMVTRPIAS